MKQVENTFEQNIQRLEQIVRVLERGEAPLEESLKLFQEGTALISCCEKLLSDAELKIKKVSAGEKGQPVEEELDHESAV